MAFLAVLKKEGPKTQILFRFRIFINLHSSTGEGEGAIDHYTITSRLLVGKHERRTNCMNLPVAFACTCTRTRAVSGPAGLSHLGLLPDAAGLVSFLISYLSR